MTSRPDAANKESSHENFFEYYSGSKNSANCGQRL